jgi:TonB family protein
MAIGDESKTVPIEKVQIQGERLSFEIHDNAGQNVRFQFTPTRTFLVGESTIGRLNSRVCLSPQQDGGASTGHDNCDRVYNYGGPNSGAMLVQRVEVPYDLLPANTHSAVVQLSFEIGVDGTATNIKVLRSSGLGLDEKTVETVKQWRFKPARKDGMPVAVPMTLDIVIRNAG